MCLTIHKDIDLIKQNVDKIIKRLKNAVEFKGFVC